MSESEPKGLTTFDPVPVRPRHDGWTAERQIAFIEALAASGCVEHACRAVGMSHVSAYMLRLRPDAKAFRDAWNAALDYSLHRLEQAAIGRALNGVPRPIFYKGEQVGEWREHDERLTMFLLRYRRPQRYGAWPDGAGPPSDPDKDDETAARLAWTCEEIEIHGDLDDESDSVADSPPA